MEELLPLLLEIHTIGHSTHPIETFVALLERHGITALGDVRSAPYNRRRRNSSSSSDGGTIHSRPRARTRAPGEK